MNDYKRMMIQHPSLFRNDDALLRIISDSETITDWERTKGRELQSQDSPVEWAKIGIILDDPFFIVFRDLVEFPDGTKRGYSRVVNRADLEGGQGVVVMPVLDDKLLLLRQFRHPTRSWHFEFPRGYGEPGISPEENAAKELYEETGGTASRLTPIGKLHSNSGFEATPVSLFMASLASIGEPEAAEGISSFEWLSCRQFEEWVATGKVTDCFSIAAYSQAKFQGLLAACTDRSPQDAAHLA
jgi:ADP-ribose pyrophosphatase